ncbi:MAG: ATP-binding cassette domain-containing protein, partial [Candidatus Bathyarchaeota archaeon]
MPIVDIRDVSFIPRFEAGILKDFDLQIEEGTINILTGDSMSGTKLALQVLNGLIPESIVGEMTGEVIVDGINVAEVTIAEMALHVGMVLENPAEMIVSLTVEEDIAFGLQNLGLETDEIQARVRESLERTRLTGFQTRNPNTLSGGELQCAAIAGVLAMRPKLIALIDPIAPLDPVGKSLVCDLIVHLNENYGITFMISEPGMNIEPLAAIAHRIIVMDDGAVVRSGDPEEVFSEKESWDLGLPQVTELFLELRKKNPKLPLPVTLEEAEEEVRRLAKGKKVKTPKRRSKAEKNEKEAVVKIRNVVHRFESEPPVIALNGINLDIYDGDFVGIIGQNGGGKTTLAYHMLGLEKPTNEDSEISVAGVDVKTADLSDLTSHINYSFQNPDHQLFCETVED